MSRVVAVVRTSAAWNSGYHASSVKHLLLPWLNWWVSNGFVGLVWFDFVSWFCVALESMNLLTVAESVEDPTVLCLPKRWSAISLERPDLYSRLQLFELQPTALSKWWVNWTPVLLEATSSSHPNGTPQALGVWKQGKLSDWILSISPYARRVWHWCWDAQLFVGAHHWKTW